MTDIRVTRKTEFRVVNVVGSVLWQGTDNVVGYIAKEAGFKVQKRDVEIRETGLDWTDV